MTTIRVHGLGLVLALLPAYLIRFEIRGLPTTALEILLVGFFVLVFVTTNHRDIIALERLDRINYVIGLFVLAGIISTVISPEPFKALGQLKAFIIEPVLFFYAAVLTIKSPRHLSIILKWLLLSLSVMSLFGIIQYFTHLGLPLRFWGSGFEPKRIVSIFEYPNALALYLAPTLMFFAALTFKSTYIRPYIHFLGLGLMGTALLLTQSRGAWLAGLIGLAFIGIKNYKFSSPFGTKAIGIIGMTLLIATLVLPTIRDRLTFTDPSGLAHLDLMQIGVTKILGNPFLGNGLFGFRQTLEQANYPGEILNYPHNVFLNFWLELGLLGFLSFFLIIRFTLDQYKKTPSPVGFAAVTFLLVMLIHGLVDVPYFKNDIAILFWFMVALPFIPINNPNLPNGQINYSR